MYSPNQHCHTGWSENGLPKIQWHNGKLSFPPMKMTTWKAYHIFGRCHIKQNVVNVCSI